MTIQGLPLWPFSPTHELDDIKDLCRPLGSVPTRLLPQNLVLCYYSSADISQAERDTNWHCSAAGNRGASKGLTTLSDYKRENGVAWQSRIAWATSWKRGKDTHVQSMRSPHSSAEHSTTNRNEQCVCAAHARACIRAHASGCSILVGHLHLLGMWYSESPDGTWELGRVAHATISFYSYKACCLQKWGCLHFNSNDTVLCCQKLTCTLQNVYQHPWCYPL